MTDVTSQGLHVLTKPIGPICNLDCEYCFYLHKDQLYGGGERWRMSDETLEAYLRQTVEAQPDMVDEITFAWQGGEPTLMGVEFYERAVELQRKLVPANKRIQNTIQTNGVLLDDRWCEFLRANRFLVGLSIDGPAELHDRYRRDKQGRPTFEAVLRGLKLLEKHGVEYNLLIAVNRHNGDHGRRVYTYLRDNGAHFVQFIPIVERRAVGTNPVSSRSVQPEQFGDFLIEVFDEWIHRDVGRVYVQIIEEAVRAWLGLEPALCLFRRQCGRAIVLEHNGDLYSCDHFVDPNYKLGNIHDRPIIELANGDGQVRFGQDKEAALPEYCRQCDVRFVCNGECPKNRFIKTPDGDTSLNYLCAGYRKFFRHVDPTMRMIVDEIKQGRQAANVMHRLNAERRAKKKQVPYVSGPPGRNDPCPCGSGKKYKKCCMRR
ncbi:MAG: anaerobic sulfatase maturase [Planctomycetes bacterium]|nr:anaerobic sulfatase maturase [Planctomycetota bacterium]MBL7039271.1 anaerobic sulfatase maturase [Pirellulaceae bacterium]